MVRRHRVPCYSGEPTAQTKLRHAFGGKGIWFTECSGSHGPTDPPAQVFCRHAEVARPQPRDRCHPQLGHASSTGTSPWTRPAARTSAAATPAPALSPSARGTVSRRTPSTTRSGTSRQFVLPGAVRIASTSFGTTGWNGQIMDVAFRNPDGSTALVVHNENDDPRTFAVARGGRSFDYTLPGGALATFTWPQGGAGRRLRPGAAERCHRHRRRRRRDAARRRRRDARDPVDDRRGPAAGAAPAGRPGPARLRRVVLTPASTGDYPRRARRSARRQHRRSARDRRRLRPAHEIDVPAPEPATCASTRRPPPRPGGRSPTFASTADAASGAALHRLHHLVGVRVGVAGGGVDHDVRDLPVQRLPARQLGFVAPCPGRVAAMAVQPPSPTRSTSTSTGVCR